MAILAFDGRKLDLLATWSGETAALTAAIERAKARPTLGLTAMDARRSFGDDQDLRNQAMNDTIHPTGGGHGNGDDAAGNMMSDMPNGCWRTYWNTAYTASVGRKSSNARSDA